MKSILSIFLLFIAANASAADFSVTSTNDAGPGTLRQAILDANAMDGGPHTITFREAYPFLGRTILQSALPVITASEVRFHGSDRRPIIDGDGSHSILIAIGDVTLEVEDMRFRSGVNSSGGCIANNTYWEGSGSLTVRRSYFTLCNADFAGGAIHWDQLPPALVTIEDSEFIQNTVSSHHPHGGAINTAITTVIRRSVFRDNSVQRAGTPGGGGGAARINNRHGGINEVSQSTFESNTVGPNVTPGSSGGALRVSIGGNGLLLLKQNYFSHNTAGWGGAVSLSADPNFEDVSVYAENNTFAYNSATSAGGALAATQYNMSLQHQTFFANNAPIGSHLIFQYLEVTSFVHNVLGETLTSETCDFTEVPTPKIGTMVANLFFEPCGLLSANGGTVTENLNVLDIDETERVGVVIFQPGADPIDGGTNDGSYCLDIDARGNTRPQDGNNDGITACDVGAYEQPGLPILINGFEGF